MGVNDRQTTLEPEARGRRPIPLPPSSLRPPPRTREPARYHPEPAARVPEAEPGSLGTRRGFWVGLALPVVGLGIAAVLWWAGDGGLERGAPAAPIPRPMEVRSRVTGTPAAGATPGGPEAASEGSRPPAVGREAGAAPAARSAAAASPGDPEVTVQVGSYRTRAKAERVLAEVQERTGLGGVVLDSRVDGVAWHRILLGAFATPEAARKAVRPLAGEHEVMVRPLPDRWAAALAGAPAGDAAGEAEGGAP